MDFGVQPLRGGTAPTPLLSSVKDAVNAEFIADKICQRLRSDSLVQLSALKPQNPIQIEVESFEDSLLLIKNVFPVIGDVDCTFKR